MNPNAQITLVLFDIDGTLLDTHGAGRAAFVQALESVFGWKDDLNYIRFEGATDLDVLRRVMARHGKLPNKEDEARFFQQLPIEMEKTVANAHFTMHPGVKEALEILSRYPNYFIGLVTGNIETCARVKLRKFGLHNHFILGAFGQEHADRNQIASLALARARQKLQPGQQIAHRFLIGDTPSDIAAARALGARCIAVTTGSHSREALEDAGADIVLNDLGNVSEVLSIIGLDSPG